MNTYIGTKIIQAKPMNRREYNDLRGWVVPADENPADEGYLVEYLDGGKANVAGFSGYISWSPKEVFENAYRSTSAMTFGDALVMLKAGKRVARDGWNGKGLWLQLWKPMHSVDLPYIILMYPVGCAPYPSGARVPWLASQTDALAEDWRVIE